MLGCSLRCHGLRWRQQYLGTCWKRVACVLCALVLAGDNPRIAADAPWPDLKKVHFTRRRYVGISTFEYRRLWGLGRRLFRGRRVLALACVVDGGGEQEKMEREREKGDKPTAKPTVRSSDDVIPLAAPS